MLPLALLYAHEEHQIDGRTRFQKLIFLMQMEGNLENLTPTDTYRFEPYDYGPFSSRLYDDLDAHIERGLIDDSKEKLDEEDDIVKYKYQLKPEGRDFVGEKISDGDIERIVQEAERIVREYGDIRLPDLIDIVYSKYPDYAENSVLR
ncbi:transcriptional regulator padr-like family protein (plasmid) [Halanaeroarchaeum sulfurireducens]|uniref:Transcriptional regulator padr-like family protein n=2 Tax=Halobacteriales TaxID=2235 RepID=A0A0F7PEQ8_9EURY|nr:transcriptional regulator padr-like family protein [Halanaeroarchaeum sulfurireducens]ALG83128.1 transcriptional regulator padr-like family protein [Halanaeroarchaeum sulfurireducens]